MINKTPKLIVFYPAPLLKRIFDPGNTKGGIITVQLTS